MRNVPFGFYISRSPHVETKCACLLLFDVSFVKNSPDPNAMNLEVCIMLFLMVRVTSSIMTDLIPPLL